MAIVFVHQGGELGGAERMLEVIATHLELDRGVAVAHFCPYPGQLADYLERSYPGQVAVYPVTHRQRDAGHMFRAAAYLRKLSAALDVQVFIANAPRGYFYAALASWGRNVPTIQVVHDPVRDRMSSASGRLATPDATVFASARALDESAPSMQKRPRARVITAAIDTRRIDRAIENVEIHRDPALFVNVARRQEHKGHLCLVDAFSQLAAREPSARLLCVGEISRHADSSYISAIEDRIRDLALDDRVTFTGFLPDEELYPLLAGSAGLVHSAEHESLGLVLLEAMYLSRPVVSTSAEGPSAVVLDGETGYLVPVGAARELAERMHRLVADPDLGDRFGAAGRVRFNEHFSTAATCRKFDDLLSELGVSAGAESLPL